ncbi:MAG: fibronectin type III domain-containing protein [Bacteroidota bacterium]
MDAPPLSAPSLQSPSNITFNAFTIRWNNVNGSTGYRVDVSRNQSFTQLVLNNASVQGTSRSITNLSPGTTYYYRVRAVNQGGASGYSSNSVATNAGISGLDYAVMGQAKSYTFSDPLPGWNWSLSGGGTISNKSNSGVTVTWTNNGTWTLSYTQWGTVVDSYEIYVALPPVPAVPGVQAPSNVQWNAFRANWASVSGASKYEIDVSRNSNFTSLVVNDLETSNTYYDVSGLAKSTNYYYRVRAKNAGGTSASSSVRTVTTRQGIEGDFDVLFSDQKTYTFSNPVSGAYWEVPTGGILGSSNNTQAIITWYQHGTHTLLYKQGTSVIDQVTVEVEAHPLTAPTIRDPEDVTFRSFTAAWQNVNWADSYELDVSRNQIFTQLVVDGREVTGLSSAVEGLEDGLTYYYRVRAENPGGFSGYSTVQTVTMNEGVMGPGDAVLGDIVTYTFSDPVQNGYWFVSSGGQMSAETENSVTVNWEADGLQRVAYMQAGLMLDDLEVFIRLPPPPAQPNLLSPTDVTPNSFRARWSSVAGADHYRIDVSKQQNFANPVVAGQLVNGTSRTISGLDDETLYYYRVSAENAGGGSEYALASVNTLPGIVGPSEVFRDDAIQYTFSNPHPQGSFSLDGGGILASNTTEFAQIAWTELGSHKLTYRGGGSILDELIVEVVIRPVPAPPTTRTAINSTYQSFQARWNSSSLADSYRVDVATDMSFQEVVFENLSSTSLSKHITGLDPDRSYYYRVRAVNASGTSSPSAPRLATTTKVPTPTLVVSFIDAHFGELVTAMISSPNSDFFYEWFDAQEAENAFAEGATIDFEVYQDQQIYVAANYRGHRSERSLLTVNMDEETAYNWIQTEAFDNEGSIGGSRQYFDHLGGLFQQQSKDLSRDLILISQSNYDRLNRAALATLPVPVTSMSAFELQRDFVTAGGQPYDYTRWETDSPVPVDRSIDGSLGYYYSANNTSESTVDHSSYPFARTVFYDDGSGEVKTTAGPGDPFMTDPSKRSYVKTFPVTSELNNVVVAGKHGHKYLRVRNALGGFTMQSLGGVVVKQVARDAQGQEMVTYTDADQNVLITAYSKVAGGVPFRLRFSGTAQSGVDFHLPQQRSLSIPGFDGGLFNLVTDEPQTNINSVDAGFYRLSAGSVSYDLTYYNPAFHFYDELGRLKVSVAPNGVEVILNASDADINAAFVTDIPFATYYEYDTQGRLKETREYEAGTTRYMYRRDGQIRFSQNSLQRTKGYFSYTTYDRSGRPVESGQYTGGGQFAFESEELEGELEKIHGEDFLHEVMGREDWVRTTYDIDDPNEGATATESLNLELSSPLPAGYPVIQAQGSVTLLPGFSYEATSESTNLTIRTSDEPGIYPAPEFPFEQYFTAGAVSYTENEHSKTWYSYDDQGRVVDMWVWYKALFARPKHVGYQYDFGGNVQKVSYQEGEDDAFFHTYVYDADRRLHRAYASTDEDAVDDRRSEALQATYIYYLHGPLKQVILADGLQTIDYFYNLAGQLKAINDPNDLGADAFAQLFEYYPGDFNNSVLPAAAPATPRFDGNIARVKWRSQRPSAGPSGITTMDYTYDDRSFLAEAGTPGTEVYKVEQLTYDPNGNLLTLRRKNASGSPLHDFTGDRYFDYEDPDEPGKYTNKLRAIQGFAEWDYDEIGQLSEQRLADGTLIRPRYDVTGKVTEVLDEMNVRQQGFAYDDRGFRMQKVDHASNDAETISVRDAAGQLLAVYQKQGGEYVPTEHPIYGASRLGNYYGQNGLTQYELKDHLGNIRALVNKGTGNTDYHADYYPFGLVMQQQGQPSRYGYQGDFAEADPETGWNHFQLRQYDPVIGRWMVPDPYKQYNSPYLGMGNNPVNAVDPDGGCVGPDCPVQTDFGNCMCSYVDVNGTRITEIPFDENYGGPAVPVNEFLLFAMMEVKSIPIAQEAGVVLSTSGGGGTNASILANRVTGEITDADGLIAMSAANPSRFSGSSSDFGSFLSRVGQISTMLFGPRQELGERPRFTTMPIKVARKVSEETILIHKEVHPGVFRTGWQTTEVFEFQPPYSGDSSSTTFTPWGN